MQAPEITLANILGLCKVGGEIDRSYVVGLLVEGGWVVQPIDGDDHRRPLKLTPEGRALSRKATARFERMRLEKGDSR